MLLFTDRATLCGGAGVGAPIGVGRSPLGSGIRRCGGGPLLELQPQDFLSLFTKNPMCSTKFKQLIYQCLSLQRLITDSIAMNARIGMSAIENPIAIPIASEGTDHSIASDTLPRLSAGMLRAHHSRLLRAIQDKIP
jgi:hypothetical protein